MINLNDESYRSTLKETSKDDSGGANVEYMTGSDIQVLNFDTVKTAYTNSLGLSEGAACSVDALLFKEQNSTDEGSSDKSVFFIEFKNGKIESQIKRNIANKVRDSLLIYNDIKKLSVEDMRKQAVFILVYNAAKNPDSSRSSIAQSVMGRANQELIRFNLDRFKGLYFKEVHTYTENQFQSFLQRTFDM